MPDKKPDTDIEFTIQTDEDGWYRSELKVAGKTISTSLCGKLESALDLFRDAFPEKKES